MTGSAIIFVALLKQFVLRHPLERFKWVGIGYNVLSIVIVGFCAMLSHSGESSADGGASSGSSSNPYADSPMTGVVLILCGAFVQSLQYAFGTYLVIRLCTELEITILIGHGIGSYSIHVFQFPFLCDFPFHLFSFHS